MSALCTAEEAEQPKKPDHSVEDDASVAQEKSKSAQRAAIAKRKRELAMERVNMNCLFCFI